MSTATSTISAATCSGWPIWPAYRCVSRIATTIHRPFRPKPVSRVAGISRWTKRLIARHSTVRLAASRKAGRSLFAPRDGSCPDWDLLYYGIDLTSYRAPIDRQEIRIALGLPANTFVVGHVGRFVEQKNHALLVDIAAEVVRRDPAVSFLLVGEGALRPEIERKVAEAGLAAHVVFAGGRDDVPRLMVGAMDLFLLPSLYEGLPLVGIEAQAAGLPFRRFGHDHRRVGCGRAVDPAPAGQGPGLARWVETILAARAAGPPTPREAAVAIIEQSPFNIKRSVERVEEVYDG